MAKKNKKGSRKTTEKEFDLPEGLELLNSNGWGTRTIKWIKNNFSAIILPIIALIILGGGIYLYSQQKGEGLEIAQEDLETGITIDLEEEEMTEEEAGIEEESEEVTEEPTEETTEEAIEEAVEETEEVTDEDEVVLEEEFDSSQIQNTYTQKAQTGEGVTHLARRALKNYLGEKNLSLSAEHKIYIEDYLQNQIGSEGLIPGEEITFSRGLIEEAISQAQLLTDTQLNNLEQYSHLVPSLNY